MSGAYGDCICSLRYGRFCINHWASLYVSMQIRLCSNYSMTSHGWNPCIYPDSDTERHRLSGFGPWFWWPSSRKLKLFFFGAHRHCRNYIYLTNVTTALCRSRRALVYNLYLFATTRTDQHCGSVYVHAKTMLIRSLRELFKSRNTGRVGLGCFHSSQPTLRNGSSAAFYGHEQE